MHLIDSLEFDVALGSEERAFAAQEQLQAFLRGPALHIIESVFDEVSGELRAGAAGPGSMGPAGAAGARHDGPAQPAPGAAEVWRLDRLEVDLGPVSGADLCAQWERRLRVRLLAQLRDRLRAPPPVAATARAGIGPAAAAGPAEPMPPWRPARGPAQMSGAGIASWPSVPVAAPAAPHGDTLVAARRQADFDALQHFLVHGCLPWHRTRPLECGLAAWAQAVVLRDAPLLARQLRRADPELQQRLTRRLAEQLTPTALERLARALGMSFDRPLAGWVEAIARRAGRSGGSEAAGPLARRLWTTVLDEALQAPAGARHARHLRAALWMAAGGRGATAVARTWPPASSPTASVRSETPPAVAGPPTPVSVAAPRTPAEGAAESQPTSAVLRLRARLRHLAQRRQPHGLDAAVRDSLRSDPAALAAWAVEIGQAAAARRWLAASLPPDTWQRLLTLLAPAAAALYAPLLRRRPLGTAWMQLSHDGWPATRLRLREAALAAVLLDAPAATASTAARATSAVVADRHAEPSTPATVTPAAGSAHWLQALAHHAAARLHVEPASVRALWNTPARHRLPAPEKALAASAAAPSPSHRMARPTVMTAPMSAAPTSATHTPGRRAPDAATPAPPVRTWTSALALADDLERAVLRGDVDAAWLAWQAGLAALDRPTASGRRPGMPETGSADALLAALCRRASTRRALAARWPTARQLALLEDTAPQAHDWLALWFSPAVWARLQGRGSLAQAWSLWWWVWATTAAADAACRRFVAAWLQHAAPRLPAGWADGLPSSAAGRQLQSAVQGALGGKLTAATPPAPGTGAAGRRSAAATSAPAAGIDNGLEPTAKPLARGVDGVAAAARTSASWRAAEAADSGADANVDVGAGAGSSEADARHESPTWTNAAPPAAGCDAFADGDDAQPGPHEADGADDARLAAWLARTVGKAGARTRWVGRLGGRRLLALAARLAPAEAHWLRAWTSPSLWPLWSATGLHARAASPTAFWALWWARWAAMVGPVDTAAEAAAAAGEVTGPGARAGVDADAGAGGGSGPGPRFDRAGFVDAWLRHAARDHGLPLHAYLSDLAARWKSLQRQQRRLHRRAASRKQADAPRASAEAARSDASAPSPTAASRSAAWPEPGVGAAQDARWPQSVEEQDDPVALVLRRARALAAAPGARPDAPPRTGNRDAAPPQPRRRAGAAHVLPRSDIAPSAVAAPAPGTTAPWVWLLQDPRGLLQVQRPPALKAALEAALSDPAGADELVQRLPPAAWPLLLAWLRPAACGSVVAAVAARAAAARAAGRRQRRSNPGTAGADSAGGAGESASAPGQAAQVGAWRLALQHCFVEDRPHVPGAFERRLAQSDRPGACVAEAASAPLRRAGRAARPQPAAGLQVGQAVPVNNAGLVLLGAYAPRLFARLGLADGRAFADADAAARAVHLLQWLVDERSDREEHLLLLNKLLCGVPLATPVPREVVLQAAEQDAGRQMLQAVIVHWGALGSTSVQGLRETFLQREGRLQRDEDSWHLRVAPRAFDMLLDRLPWGYGTLKLPWMKEVLHVDWR